MEALDVRTRPRPLKVEVAYQELKRLIITLQLPPGSAINERELMKRLDLGRTPVREAILRLAHERLIVHSPRRGAWVSELSIIDLQQMIEARALIEPIVVRRAAERSTPEAVAPLLDLLARGAAAIARDDAEEAANADLDFHIAIAEMSDNAYFTAFSQQVNTSMLRFWHVTFQSGSHNDGWYDEHMELLQAIADHEADHATILAHAHVERFKARVRKLVT